MYVCVCACVCVCVCVFGGAARGGGRLLQNARPLSLSPCLSLSRARSHPPFQSNPKPPIAHSYDGTVRNSSGAVVQFLYGEDGMDGVRVEEQHFRHIQAKEPELMRVFGYPEVAAGATPDWLSAADAELLRTDTDAR